MVGVGEGLGRLKGDGIMGKGRGNRTVRRADDMW